MHFRCAGFNSLRASFSDYFENPTISLPLGGRDVGVGVKNYGSTIQFAAMYYLKAEPSPVFFERNKQHLKSLMIALLILKT